jgi:hypothetical protein
MLDNPTLFAYKFNSKKYKLYISANLYTYCPYIYANVCKKVIQDSVFIIQGVYHIINLYI